MKNRVERMMLITICISLILMPMVYAEEASEGDAPVIIRIRYIATVLIKWLSWIALAISLGFLIYIGVKYVSSGADEKANVKRALPFYLLGVFLIATSSVIANFVAVEVAGDENEDDVMRVGREAGEYFVNGVSYVEALELGYKPRVYQSYYDKKTGMNIVATENVNLDNLELVGQGEGSTEAEKKLTRYQMGAPTKNDDGEPFQYWKITKGDGTVEYVTSQYFHYEDYLEKDPNATFEPVYERKARVFDLDDDQAGHVTGNLTIYGEPGVAGTIYYENNAGDQPTITAQTIINDNGTIRHFVGWKVLEYVDDHYDGEYREGWESTLSGNDNETNIYVTTNPKLELQLEKDWGDPANSYSIIAIYD